MAIAAAGARRETRREPFADASAGTHPDRVAAR
jgi:hypothetical protein